ncbi:hypothetical protein QBC36DRAFT_291422 [Triangularia setosa]|uniref:Uncharacterized protein n=1 Tax=Triangularia setosa TaxID=2587417 RepID=A0AAN7A643_9PEZI|nr:hypothetical protein QBC36DRAFT_291422 [Podospora setosa]
MAPLLLSHWDSIVPISSSSQTPDLQPRKYVSGSGAGGGNGGYISPAVLGAGLGIGLPILMVLLYSIFKTRSKTRVAAKKVDAGRPAVKSKSGGQGGGSGSGGDRPRNLGLLDITTPLPGRESPVQVSSTQGGSSTEPPVYTAERTVADLESDIAEPPPAYSRNKPGLLDIGPPRRG